MPLLPSVKSATFPSSLPSCFSLVVISRFGLASIESLSGHLHSMNHRERFAGGCLSPILGCDGPGIWPRSPSVWRVVPVSTHRSIRSRHRSDLTSRLSSRTRRNLSHECANGEVKRLCFPAATFWCARTSRPSSCACPQSNQHIIVRPRRGIAAADINRFVSTQLMRAADDLLEKPTCVAAHNHVGRFRPGSFNCIHNISYFPLLSRD